MAPRAFLIFVALLTSVLSLTLFVTLRATSGAPAAPPPNIILITLDTTRADRMGFLGSKSALTPNLDLLAAQSAIFTRAYSHVPLTTASHATIFTGTYPQFNGVNDFGKPLPADLPYLPDLLHQHGYQTAAFVASLVLDPIGGTAPGFDRGFDIYNAGFRIRRSGEDRYLTLERRGEEVVARALQWLKTPRRKPFFLWVHLYDAHDPYEPPEPYATRYKKSPYDGEVAYVDASVGKLLAALRARGLYNDALIAVMADHGEALGEHGERSHGIFLYDETIHVPLLFKLPGAHPGAKRVQTCAGLVDVAPTILDAAGLRIPQAVQGQSLLSLMKPGPVQARSGSTAHASPDRPAYAETDYPRRAFGWSSLRSLRAGKYLFIKAPQRELYDQASDPAATHNLATASPAVTDTLAAQIEEFRGRTRSAPGATPTGLSSQQAEQLNALGYIASDTPRSQENSTEQGVDPKIKIEIANQLHDALLDVEDGRYADAVPKLMNVLSDQPQMAVAQMHLGTAFARLKKYKEALPPLQKAVDLLPDSGMGHYELGLALFETGDWPGAAKQFEVAVAHAPRWADAQFSLASVYARIDRVPEALNHLDMALQLDAEHYRANLLRGRILSLQGDSAGALPNLQKAAAVEPKSVEAHQFLSEAYAKLGQQENAAREHAAADRLKSPANP
jgi:arylsulfatase A-like enzyme/Tfp pilus assembly protein PilF